VARFEQLMAAERAIQAVAKQILADPCWKTHAFCKHVAFVWKKAWPYVKECAIWGVSGALIGAIGTGFTPLGAVAGGVAGCAAGVFGRYGRETLPDNPFFQAFNQCTTWGASAGAAAVITGAGAGVAFATGCAAGFFGYFVGNNAPGQCGVWGGAAAAVTPGGAVGRFGAGFFGCLAGVASERTG
jgi:hypothetical protein